MRFVSGADAPSLNERRAGVRSSSEQGTGETKHPAPTVGFA